MRRMLLTVAVLCALTLTGVAQQPSAPRFEVASIKLDPKQDRGGPQGFGEFTLRTVDVLPGGRIESHGRMLRDLIAWAWDINTLYQKIEGNNEILETEFNIDAKAATAALSPFDAKTMVRALLEERFRLRWRLQPRDVDVYVLMPARADGQPGTGLRSFSGSCAERLNNPTVPFASPEREARGRCGWSSIESRHRAIGQSMAAIAERLTTFMAAPVSDRTGWPGLFTFDIVPETREMPGIVAMMSRLGSRPGSSDGPQLLDVFRSELGLSLIKERTTLNDFVIERIEPLIEN